MRQYLRSGILLICTLLLFLPAQGALSTIPRGFTPVGTPERYGPPERKAADGSIFDYMDGSGMVYLDHGFRELVHCEFSSFRSGLITFDRFTMETSAQALATLADERIAPAGGSPLPLSAPNKAYRFPPDYFIYMVLDKSLIYLHVDDDTLAEILDQFAADILTQQSWIRTLDSKFKICSKKLTNFKICYKALKSSKEEKE